MANRSTRMGRAADEGEDEQEIFKALSLDKGLLDGLKRERKGKERKGNDSKRCMIRVPFDPTQSVVF